MEKKLFLSVTAYWPTRVETLFSSLRIEPGVHLRWSCYRDLGFPQHGFSIQRTTLQDEWETVCHINLPESPGEALHRITRRVADPGELLQIYREGTDELINILKYLTDTTIALPMHVRDLPGESDDTDVIIKALDAVLTACLDPYIARMVGLYWIDKDVTERPEYCYRIIGHWGAAEWPENIIEFSRLHPVFDSSEEQQFANVHIIPLARVIYVPSFDENDVEGPHLVIRGDATPAIRFAFDNSVEEIKIEYELYDGHNYVDTPSWNIRLDGLPAGRVVSDEQQMIITSAHGPFQRMDIISGIGNYWKFYRLTYRERLGPIGDITSQEILARPGDHPVSTPRISRVTSESASPILDDRGNVPLSNADVQIAGYVLAHPEYAHTPVRLCFGRSDDPALAEPSTLLTQQENLPAPVLYQPYYPIPVLPELVGYWSFDGFSKNAKNGQNALERGELRYIQDHPTYLSRRSLKLFRTGYIELRRQASIQTLGQHFTLQMWICPKERPGKPIIFDNHYSRSFGLGLQSRTYQLKCWLNGTAYLSDQRIPADTWTHVSVNYNGNTLFFYINYELDSQHDIGTVTILPNVSARVTIGAARSSSPARVRNAFVGGIADLQFWQEAMHPREADDRLAKSMAYLDQQCAHSGLIAAWPHYYNMLSHDGLVEYKNEAELDDFGTGLTLQVWVKPSLTSATYQTLIGNKWDVSFWLGLMRHGPDFRLRFWLNKDPADRNVFHSDAVIPANRWTHVSLNYDGSGVCIYLNGELDVIHSAPLGRVNLNPERHVVLGAGSGSTESAKTLPFRGILADGRIWKESLSFDDTIRDIGKPQYIDRHVANGGYAYYVRGIDIFGRLSRWSLPTAINVDAQPVYNPPVNVHAEFIFPDAVVTRVSDEGALWRITTNMHFPPALISELSTGVLNGYDLQISRTVEPDDVGRSRRIQQNFEIIEAQAVEGGILFDVKKMPFAQLNPTKRDKALLPFETKFKVQCVWTGSQRLFYPGVTNFRIYLRQGPLNCLRRKIIGVNPIDSNRFRVYFRDRLPMRRDELVDKPCQINAHMYYITQNSSFSLVLRYDGHPVIEPETGAYVQVNITADLSTFVDYNDLGQWGDPIQSLLLRENPVVKIEEQTAEIHRIAPFSNDSPEELSEEESASNEERDRLTSRGVNWIPATVFYKMEFASAVLPGELADLPAESYVPGALVAANDKGQWQAFYVFWHEQGAGSTIFYLLPHEKNEPLPVLSGHDSDPIRFYPGEHYQLELELPELPEFAPDNVSQEYVVCLTASDDRDRQSAISRKVTISAIDRRRPPTPPAPMVEVSKADYYQQSRVMILWTDGDEGIAYLLYRATDVAICSRDLQQRRGRTGCYKKQSPEIIFSHDPDFGEWLAARFPEMDDLSAMFPEKASADWESVTPIWRAWAERFYPALTNEELSVIAQQDGNETAFTLVNAKPVRGGEYTDKIPGMVRNRYYYRLRSQNAAVQQSSHWSPVSSPVVPPNIRQPKSPVFTKIEAEDRRIILRWSVDRDPAIAEYRLFRSELKQALEDLRWWRTGLDPRIVAIIPDPLLRVRNRGLDIPGEFSIAAILGVYRVDEFDFEAASPEHQPQTLNYFNPSPSEPSETPSTFTPNPEGQHRINSLRRIVDGVPMVVVYRDAEDRINRVAQAIPIPPFIDDGLTPLQDYYYRLVAVDADGNVSEPSAIVSARCPEIELPQPPEWVSGEWVKLAADGSILPYDSPSGTAAIQLTWEPATTPESQVRLQRKSAFGSWQNISEWLSGETTEFVDADVDPAEDYDYRITVLSPGGNTNREYSEYIVSNITL